MNKNQSHIPFYRGRDIWVVDIIKKVAYKSGILQPFIPRRSGNKIDISHKNTDEAIDNSNVNTDKEIGNSHKNIDKEVDNKNDNIDKDDNKINDDNNDDEEEEEREDDDDEDKDEEILYNIENIAITKDEKDIVASNKKNRNLYMIDIKTFETYKSLAGQKVFYVLYFNLLYYIYMYVLECIKNNIIKSSDICSFYQWFLFVFKGQCQTIDNIWTMFGLPMR